MVRSPGGGFFVETTVPEQREQANGVLFPRLLQPGGGGGAAAAASDLNSLVEAIKKHKSWLEQQLKLSGAVLLRGFGVHTAEDFNAVVEAFDYPELPYIGGAAPRYKVVGRIYTTNDSPPDQTVTFHHEMAQVGPAAIYTYIQKRILFYKSSSLQLLQVWESELISLVMLFLGGWVCGYGGFLFLFLVIRCQSIQGSCFSSVK